MPSSRDDWAAAEEVGRRLMAATVRPIVAGHNGAASEGPGGERRLDLPSLDEMRSAAVRWMHDDPPPRRWLLDDVLPLGEVGVVAATGGSSKTWLLLQTAIGVASASGIAGFGAAGPLWSAPIPRPVLLLTAEERADDLHYRVHAIGRMLRLSDQQRAWLGENLHIASLRGQPTRINRRDGRGLFWVQTDAARQLRELAGSIPDLGLLVIDPASRFRSGEETDPDAATAFVEWMESVSEATGATVTTSAHVNKAAKASPQLHQDMLRGSSGLVDGVRWCLGMRKMTEEEAKLHSTAPERAKRLISAAVIKANNVSVDETWWLERMDSGVLMRVRLGRGQAAPSVHDARYAKVIGAVQELLRTNPEEHLTARKLEREYAGLGGLLKCSDKALRGMLQRARSEGHVLVAEGGRLEVGKAV